MRMMASCLKLIAVLMVSCAAITAFAMPTFNMSPGVTAISQEIYDLHMTIFTICVIIGIIVFGVMFYALYKHRKSRGHVASKFHENTKLEVFWAIVPLLILIVMAVPATKVLTRMTDSSKADINIKITGYQWKWKYEYLDEGISYFSNLSTPNNQIQNKVPKDEWYLLEVDKPLVVPINKKIRFLVTSNDVIHSWWVPALGIKRDAIPGFIHEAWTRIEKPGIYRGQCAELCGVNHGYMPIVVIATTQEEYDKWVKENAPSASQKKGAALTTTTLIPTKLTHAELMRRGESVYESTCSVCHKSDGAGMPPAFPALKGSQIATGPVQNHIEIVLDGKRGTAMQAFGSQLNDADIAAVITYERNSWGNNKAGGTAGGTVQPTDVAKLRK